MVAQFLIDGVDFTSYIKSDGIKWSRNDIDASKSGRNKNATMKRKRVASKVKLSVSCRNLSHAQMKYLNSALDHETISVTYLDPIYGVVSKLFYGSSVESTTQISQCDDTFWSGTSFSLTEV